MISLKNRLMFAHMLQLFTEVNSDKGLLVWEGEVSEGLEVFVYDEETNDLVPAPNGTYTLEDETVVEIADGKIASYTTKEPDTTPEPPAEPEPTNQAEEPEPEPEPTEDEKDTRIKELEDTITEKDAEIEKLQARIKELEDAETQMSAQIKEQEEKLKMSAAEPAHRVLRDIPERKAGSILSVLQSHK